MDFLTSWGSPKTKAKISEIPKIPEIPEIPKDVLASILGTFGIFGFGFGLNQNQNS